VLGTLCLTQIVSWGVLYYAFPVIMPDITHTTGWSGTVVMGAFSLSLLTAAASGVVVGRLIDRSGPRIVMTAGSVVGVVAVGLVALAPNLGWFVTAWILAGLAQSAVLYPPAFAALTRWYGPARVRALTVLTLVAGLASTVFAPLTATLLDHLDWRQTYLALAVVLAVTTIPAHLFGLRAPWPSRGTEPAPTAARRRDPAVRTIARSGRFAALVASTTLVAFALSSAAINLVPMLAEEGWSASHAAWALGITGAAQLLGRLGYAGFAARTAPRTRSVLVPAMAALPVLALAFASGHRTVLAACVALGVLRGAFTLVESTAISDRWGTRHFGTLYGMANAPATVAVASAPWAGAVIAERAGGYASLFSLLAAIALLGAVVAVGSASSRTTVR
jgi:MFS family permease